MDYLVSGQGLQPGHIRGRRKFVSELAVELDGSQKEIPDAAMD
jgi:hypothetical protein